MMAACAQRVQRRVKETGEWGGQRREREATRGGGRWKERGRRGGGGRGGGKREGRGQDCDGYFLWSNGGGEPDQLRRDCERERDWAEPFFCG